MGWLEDSWLALLGIVAIPCVVALALVTRSWLNWRVSDKELPFKSGLVIEELTRLNPDYGIVKTKDRGEALGQARFLKRRGRLLRNLRAIYIGRPDLCTASGFALARRETILVEFHLNGTLWSFGGVVLSSKKLLKLARKLIDTPETESYKVRPVSLLSQQSERDLMRYNLVDKASDEYCPYLALEVEMWRVCGIEEPLASPLRSVALEGSGQIGRVIDFSASGVRIEMAHAALSELIKGEGGEMRTVALCFNPLVKFPPNAQETAPDLDGQSWLLGRVVRGNMRDEDEDARVGVEFIAEAGGSVEATGEPLDWHSLMGDRESWFFMEIHRALSQLVGFLERDRPSGVARQRDQMRPI